MPELLRVAALVSLCLLGTAAVAQAQPTDHVRLTLLESSARSESRSCALEVVVSKTGGEAILTCERRTSPVSQLAAHRALTTSEASRLHLLASVPAASRSLPQRTGSPAPASVDRGTATVTIARGTHRVVLDVSEGLERLSGDDRQVLRLLREIADELRGAGHR